MADEILKASLGNSPIEGKYMVLIGTLLGLDRQDSAAFLSQLGAKVQPDINLQTQYVILGSLCESEFDTLAGITTRRQKDIADRKENGQALTILSQRQLLAMLPAGLETARDQER
jgi:hypothetical protein